MALEKGSLSKDLKEFIKQTQKMSQEDADLAIETYCTNMETSIYKAIKSLTLTIPAGFLNVQGSATNQTNLTPLTITGDMLS